MHDQKREIVHAMDFMFTILVFYVLIQWSYITTMPAKILFIFTAITVINDWTSFRATTEIYSGGMFICDLLIVFFVANMTKTITYNNTYYGYGVDYWFYFGFLLSIYSIWDYVVAQVPQTSNEGKKRLYKWMIIMGFNSILSFLAYYIQIDEVNFNHVTRTWIPILPAGVFFITLIFWNIHKWSWFYKQLSNYRRG